MGQLNVTFDEAMLTAIDRLAAARGINRPELLRALVREAMGAEGKETEACEQHRAQVDATGLAVLSRHLQQLAIDLDRATRDQDRRETRLAKALAARVDTDEAGRAQVAEAVAGRIGDDLAGLEHRLVKRMAALAEAHAVEDIGVSLLHVQQQLSAGLRPAPGIGWYRLAMQATATFVGAMLALLVFWMILHRQLPAAIASPEPTFSLEPMPVEPSSAPRHRSKHP